MTTRHKRSHTNRPKASTNAQRRTVCTSRIQRSRPLLVTARTRLLTPHHSRWPPDRTCFAKPHGPRAAHPAAEARTTQRVSMYSLSRLLKESWTLVEEQQDKLASYFYARMFLNNPQLRDLFPVQMDVQRSRLLGAIVTAVQTVDNPEHFDEYLQSLGRDHRKFHVQPEHYEVVGGALLEALRTYGGDQWTIEFDQAWRDAYARIAEVMIEGAEADSS